MAGVSQRYLHAPAWLADLLMGFRALKSSRPIVSAFAGKLQNADATTGKRSRICKYFKFQTARTMGAAWIGFPDDFIRFNCFAWLAKLFWEITTEPAAQPTRVFHCGHRPFEAELKSFRAAIAFSPRPVSSCHNQT